MSNDSILGQCVWRTYAKLEIKEMVLSWDTLVKNSKNDPLVHMRSHNLTNGIRILKQCIEAHKELGNIGTDILLQEDSIQYSNKTDDLRYRIIITKNKNGGDKNEKNHSSSAS